jgi:hypothetical protein
MLYRNSKALQVRNEMMAVMYCSGRIRSMVKNEDLYFQNTGSGSVIDMVIFL